MSNGTILVIDDHRELANLVQRALAQEGFDVIIATDGASGLEIARNHRPDLVVLDLTMPGLDGLEVCRRLRGDTRQGRIPIIVLSARASEADRVLGLEQGADDYLVKPFGPKELLARVKAVLRRAAPPEEKRTVIRIGELALDLAAYQATVAGEPIGLSPAEFRILHFLATHAGKAFSRDEIIDDAIRSDVAVTERTVDAHITGIRKKLGAAADLIETVRTVGYRIRNLASP